jgi:SH3-like domain-containing protein
LTDFSCSVGATCWCLRSVGVEISQQELQAVMVPALVSPDDGLLDASGATIARLLRDRWGLPAAHQPVVSFDELARRAGRQPLAVGGRNWHNGVGHWVAVRGFDGERLLLANPGGSGPNFGQQALDRTAFELRGPFSAVWIDVDASARAPSGRARFRVVHTGGEGANLRREPSEQAERVGAVREGALLSGGSHAWRQVTTARGEQGWVAEAFLVRDGDSFRVSNTGGEGVNLRREPSETTERVQLLPEGTTLAGGRHAWRRVAAEGGEEGWIAETFLAAL